jgi:hypothetical protein
MAIGDSDDIVARQKSALPQGWFADAAAPVLGAVLAGFAAIGAFAYALLQSAKGLMRIGTSFGGWLEITALDYFGPERQFPRYPGETDSLLRDSHPKFVAAEGQHPHQHQERARVLLTGNPVRMIEPWDPRDTGCWNRSFWGVNTATRPGQWANGGDRYGGLIVCMLPGASGSGSKWLGWNDGFWGNSVVLGVIASWWSAGSVSSTAAAQVYALINKLRMVGVRVYVRFTSDPRELSDAQTLTGTSLDFSNPVDSGLLPGLNT